MPDRASPSAQAAAARRSARACGLNPVTTGSCGMDGPQSSPVASIKSRSRRSPAATRPCSGIGCSLAAANKPCPNPALAGAALGRSRACNSDFARRSMRRRSAARGSSASVAMPPLLWPWPWPKAAGVRPSTAAAGEVAAPSRHGNGAGGLGSTAATPADAGAVLAQATWLLGVSGRKPPRSRRSSRDILEKKPSGEPSSCCDGASAVALPDAAAIATVAAPTYLVVMAPGLATTVNPPLAPTRRWG